MKECKTNKVVTLGKHFNKAGFQVLLWFMGGLKNSIFSELFFG
jgi:hypothetical protein